MNSLLKSVGKIFLTVFLLSLTSCKSSSGADDPPASVQVRQQLEGEVSLKADREALAELRKEIPEQKRQANDELALILQLMGDTKKKPSEIQAHYQQAVQKRRGQYRAKVSQLREDFKRDERKRKDNFLEEQKQNREDFKSKSAERKEVQEFYGAQDRLRRDFFSGESDRRQDFESEVNTQGREFDSYMREQQKEFSEQQKLYSKRYFEAEKEKKNLNKPQTLGSGAGP